MKHGLLLTLGFFLITPSLSHSGDSATLAEFRGVYSGDFVGTFEGESASATGTVRLPRARNRKVTISVLIDGEMRTVNGRVNQIRVRPKRVVYRGVARVSYLGLSASGVLRGTARQKKGFKSLRIPIYLSRSFFGDTYTLTGRFLGRKDS